jgi:hypothetical protein
MAASGVVEEVILIACGTVLFGVDRQPFLACFYDFSADAALAFYFSDFRGRTVVGLA